MFDLFQLNERILSEWRYNNKTYYVTHTSGAFSNTFENFDKAYKDLEETYCYNFFTGKKLSKQECEKIKSKQKIIKIA